MSDDDDLLTAYDVARNELQGNLKLSVHFKPAAVKLALSLLEEEKVAASEEKVLSTKKKVTKEKKVKESKKKPKKVDNTVESGSNAV